MEPEELAESLKRLTAWAEQHAPTPSRRCGGGCGTISAGIPAICRSSPATRGVGPSQLPGGGRRVVRRPRGRGGRPAGDPGLSRGLAELVRRAQWGPSSSSARVEHVTVPLGEQESITCVQSGLWLVRDGEGPLVVMLRARTGMGESLGARGDGGRPRARRARPRGLRKLMRERNVYRGRVLELRSRHFHDDEGAPLTVRTLPEIARDRIVLPARRAGAHRAPGVRHRATTPSACARAGATCAAACCSTARRASARR